MKLHSFTGTKRAVVLALRLFGAAALDFPIAAQESRTLPAAAQPESVAPVLPNRQPSAGRRGGQPGESVLPEVAAEWGKRIDRFEINDLPMTEVANYLRQLFPSINFIVPERVQNATVRVTLRSVNLGEILRAIELASEGRIRSSVGQTGQGSAIDPATGLPVLPDPRSNLVSFGVGAPAEPANPVACRVFNISRYLEGLSEKETSSAIEALHDTFAFALGLLGKMDSEVSIPEFKIHPATRLLIVVGHPKELSVVEQVVAQLPVYRHQMAPPSDGDEPRKK